MDDNITALPSPQPWTVRRKTTGNGFGHGQRGAFEIVDANGNVIGWLRGGRMTTDANAKFIEDASGSATHGNADASR